MSIIVILGVIVIVSFVLGLVFIFKGYVSGPSTDNVVPVEDLDSVQKEMAAIQAQKEELTLQLDTIAIELEKTRGEMEASRGNEDLVQSLKSQEEEYIDKIEHLEKNLMFLTQKADMLAQESIDVINTLSTENEMLQKEAVEGRNKVAPEVVDQLMSEKDQLQAQITENLSKIKQLESDLDGARQRADEKSEQADTTIQQLQNENQELQSGLKAITAKVQEAEEAFMNIMQAEDAPLAEARQEIVVLQDEIQSLQKHIADHDTLMKKLENELADSRAETNQVSETIETLKEENLHLQEQAATSIDQGPQQVALQQGHQELERHLTKLQGVNAHLMEKEKMLQFEFTKSRAQVAGLEKICAEFKKQLDRENREDLAKFDKQK